MFSILRKLFVIMRFSMEYWNILLFIISFDFNNWIWIMFFIIQYGFIFYIVYIIVLWFNKSFEDIIPVMYYKCKFRILFYLKNIIILIELYISTESLCLSIYYFITYNLSLKTRTYKLKFWQINYLK